MSYNIHTLILKQKIYPSDNVYCVLLQLVLSSLTWQGINVIYFTSLISSIYKNRRNILYLVQIYPTNIYFL